MLRDGKPVQVDALSEVEPVDFPAPVGKLEAFHTGGGISTMPFAYEGKVEVMEYKTLRYPGTSRSCARSASSGCWQIEPIEVKGKPVVPARPVHRRREPRLHKPEGQRPRGAPGAGRPARRTGGRHAVTFRLIDYYDGEHGISAMMRTTGYSLSITGQMQADGRWSRKGVYTPDEAMPFEAYVAELAKRGVKIEETSRRQRWQLEVSSERRH